ncbi:hypothetical protein [Paenibacillus bovis]|uniref:Uncharacterized protein n=1 Tax=Paenibacillus bovis TaxID=1616788 RepID=A0A172ZB82_9BACL|nr:hypothetical protein [Paenibacillus bovis]ANF94905.1 hypothetical protein AR543_01895 [Paenibacillus bovis]
MKVEKTMYKIYSGIFCVIFFLFICSCSTESVSINDRHATNKYSNATTEKDSSELAILKKDIVAIHNKKLSIGNRKRILEKFVPQFTEWLNNPDNSNITDTNLEKIFFGKLTSMTQNKVFHNGLLTIKIVSYQAPAEITGDLESRYTFIQWSDQNGLNHAQLLIDADIERVEQLLVYTSNNKTELVLIGHSYLYSPEPVFISVWELNKAEWSRKKKDINNLLYSMKNWGVSLENEEIIIKNQSTMSIKSLNGNEGFLVIDEDNSSIKVNLLNNFIILAPLWNISNNYKVDEKQSFQVNLYHWGTVKFVSIEEMINGLPQLKFILIDESNQEIYRFPEFYGNSLWPSVHSIKAVSFQDVNGDKCKDVVIIAEYITGVGKQAAEPFSVASIYFQDQDGTFQSIPALDDKLNGNTAHNRTVAEVVKYASQQNIKVN